MKQMKFSLTIFVGVALCVLCWSARPAMAKTNAELPTTVQGDPDPEKVHVCMAFLEAFYDGLNESGLDAAYVRQFVTSNAKQYLMDSYAFDCGEGEECMATWLFCYNTTADVMGENKRIIQVIDENTYVVTTIYGDTAYGDYVYGVKLGLVKDGDSFKIDSIEEVTNIFPDAGIAG